MNVTEDEAFSQSVSVLVCQQWQQHSAVGLRAAPRQHQHSLHHLAKHTHKGLHISPQLPALSGTSSAAGCLSGEVISHNPRDSACASVCVVIGPLRPPSL